MSTPTRGVEPVVVPEMEKRVRRLEREFDQILRKAESAEVGVRERLQAARADFDAKRTALLERLEKTRDATSAAQKELASGLEAAWSELSDSFNAARNELLRTH